MRRPRHEEIEAFRWTRALIASGQARRRHRDLTTDVFTLRKQAGLHIVRTGGRVLALQMDSVARLADVLRSGRRARRFLERATRSTPAADLELLLRTVRVENERDATDSVAWAPAWQLAAPAWPPDDVVAVR